MTRSAKTMKKTVSERQRGEEVEKVASTGAGNEVLCHDQNRRKLSLLIMIQRKVER